MEQTVIKYRIGSVFGEKFTAKYQDLGFKLADFERLELILGSRTIFYERKI